MQWFIRNPYDLHIKIKPILSLKWKRYSAHIHCEGELAQGAHILCLRVTWLSVEATGCCRTSLLRVGSRKKKKSIFLTMHSRLGVKFPSIRWHKAGSLQDSTQHIHPPKKEQGKLRQWHWMSTGWRTGSVFIEYSSEYIYPSRQSSQEGLVLLEMSQYGMTKTWIKA